MRCTPDGFTIMSRESPYTMRIADCGLGTAEIRDPKSEIRNRVRRLIPPIAISWFCLVPVCFGLEYPFTSVDIFSRDLTPGTTTYDPSRDTYTG